MNERIDSASYKKTLTYKTPELDMYLLAMGELLLLRQHKPKRKPKVEGKENSLHPPKTPLPSSSYGYVYLFLPLVPASLYREPLFLMTTFPFRVVTPRSIGVSA